VQIAFCENSTGETSLGEAPVTLRVIAPFWQASYQPATARQEYRANSHPAGYAPCASSLSGQFRSGMVGHFWRLPRSAAW